MLLQLSCKEFEIPKFKKSQFKHPKQMSSKKSHVNVSQYLYSSQTNILEVRSINEHDIQSKIHVDYHSEVN